MEKILKDPIFNVPKQRIVAVDATKLDVDKHFTFPPNCIRASVKEYACLLSHLETIKKFSTSKYNTALIFEDDVDIITILGTIYRSSNAKCPIRLGYTKVKHIS